MLDIFVICTVVLFLSDYEMVLFFASIVATERLCLMLVLCEIMSNRMP